MYICGRCSKTTQLCLKSLMHILESGASVLVDTVARPSQVVPGSRLSVEAEEHPTEKAPKMRQAAIVIFALILTAHGSVDKQLLEHSEPPVEAENDRVPIPTVPAMAIFWVQQSGSVHSPCGIVYAFWEDGTVVFSERVQEPGRRLIMTHVDPQKCRDTANFICDSGVFTAEKMIILDSSMYTLAIRDGSRKEYAAWTRISDEDSISLIADKCTEKVRSMFWQPVSGSQSREINSRLWEEAQENRK